MQASICPFLICVTAFLPGFGVIGESVSSNPTAPTMDGFGGGQEASNGIDLI
jgi:hypothetical protein